MGNRAGRRCVAAKALWIGPAELVVLGIVRTGRVDAWVVLLSLAAVLAALARDTPVRLGVRAAIDAVARLVVMPLHAWSAAMLVLDTALIAAALLASGRAGKGS